jgi:hypothetical protein
MNGKDPVLEIAESIPLLVGVYISHKSNLSIYCLLNQDKQAVLQGKVSKGPEAAKHVSQDIRWKMHA